MRNAFLKYIPLCSLLIAGGFTAITASAQERELATVTFTEPVAVGRTILPPGQYRITDTGTDSFLIQAEHGHAAAVVTGTRFEELRNNGKTNATLKNDGENMRLNKLTLSEYSTVYNFRP